MSQVGSRDMFFDGLDDVVMLVGGVVAVNWRWMRAEFNFFWWYWSDCLEIFHVGHACHFFLTGFITFLGKQNNLRQNF